MNAERRVRSELVLIISLISACLTPARAGGPAQPASLVSLGLTLYRVNAAGTGAVESFPNQPGGIIGMTLVPPGVSVVGCGEGNVLAVQYGNGYRFWRVDSARAGTPALVEIGRLPSGYVKSIAFAHGRLFGIDGESRFREFSLTDFHQIGPTTDLGMANVGGLTFDGVDTWYTTAGGGCDCLRRYGDPPTAGTNVGGLGVGFDDNGLEMYAGQLWAALRSPQTSAGHLLVGSLNMQTGVFSQAWDVVAAPANMGVGYVAFSPACLDVARQPMARTTCTSGTAFFSVTAAGTGPFSYQWQIETAPGVWTTLGHDPLPLPCGGFAFATMPFSNRTQIGVQPCSGVSSYQIRCVVSSDCGSTTSIEATLSVVDDAQCGACCVPDSDGAGGAGPTCAHVPGTAECNDLRFTCNVTELLPPTFTGCYGDADGNGTVNPGDRGFIAANISQTDAVKLCLYDMDGNGFINAGDRGFVAANIGLCTPLPDWQNGSGLNHGVPDTRFAPPVFMGPGTTCATATCP